MRRQTHLLWASYIAFGVGALYCSFSSDIALYIRRIKTKRNSLGVGAEELLAAAREVGPPECWESVVETHFLWAPYIAPGVGAPYCPLSAYIALYTRRQIYEEKLTWCGRGRAPGGSTRSRPRETGSAPARAAPESPHIPISPSRSAGSEVAPEIPHILVSQHLKVDTSA